MTGDLPLCLFMEAAGQTAIPTNGFPSAGISLYGEWWLPAYSFGEKAMKLSPLHHISKKTPPTLLIHGDSDSCVDIEHSRAFCKRMAELGRPGKLIVLEGADHAFSVFKYGPDRSVRRAISEIDRHLMNLGWLPGPQPAIDGRK